MSLLDSLKGLVSNEMVSAAASHLGESNEGVQKAMGGIFPTLLGGLMNSKSDDHSMLSGLFSQASGDNNLVGNLIGGLTGGSGNSSMNIGSSLISGLLGNKAGMAVDLISKFAGIKSGSSNALMGIGGSLLASFLGKKMSTEGLGIGSLINWITGQKSEIMSAAPAGLASSLGFGNLASDAVNTVSNAASNVSGKVSETINDIEGVAGGNGGGMKWLLPLLLLGLLGAGIWYFTKGCNKTEEMPTIEETATMPETNATTTVDSTANAGTTAPTVTAGDATIKLANNTELKVPAGSIAEKFYNFINDANAKAGKDAWIDFENLNFETGSSKLKAGSDAILQNVVDIMKAYPAVKIKVGGYTDNVGDSMKNVKLSGDRAATVYNALVSKGAAKTQFVENPHEGYGPQHPVADNNTEEGRARNRRISICVREK